MTICPDCKENDNTLSIMVLIGTETIKQIDYVILECITCGSSIRVKKAKK